MKFEIVMNMPVRLNEKKEEYARQFASVPLVHRLIVEHPSRSLEEFVATLERHDFVIVEEYFFDNYQQKFTSYGPIALNHRYIGKIKPSER